MDSHSNRITIVIADDHPIFRDGLKRLLEAEGSFELIGEASDGAEAVELVRRVRPDVLLLDLAMPFRNPRPPFAVDRSGQHPTSQVRNCQF